jgi:glycogen(starch) synthase
MRVAYISYEYPPDTAHGGIATYVAQAARMMANRGHDVEVFAASPSRQVTLDSDGVIQHLIRAKDNEAFARGVVEAFHLRHLFKAFDLIEATEWQADARFAVTQAPNVALVIKMHTPTVVIDRINKKYQNRDRWIDPMLFSAWREAAFPRGVMNRFRNRLRRFYSESDEANPLYRSERSITQSADLVVPPCIDLCDFAIGYWGIQSVNVRLTPYPYSANPEYLAIPSTSTGKVVGFVGRLERRKGIEVLAKAIPQILDYDPTVSLRLIGQPVLHVSGVMYDVWLKRRLGKYASRIQIVGKVPLDQMHQEYADLDVCVFPSIWENFPNVCLEAMSAGRAIVASDGGGMREMLDNGRCGVIIPSGDHRSLAKAVISLLRDPEQRNHFGRVARERVLTAYHPDVIGALMEEVYEEAIRRARVRTGNSPVQN